MKKYRFEKTDYGYRAFVYSKAARAYVYIGHFYTKSDAFNAAAQN